MKWYIFKCTHGCIQLEIMIGCCVRGNNNSLVRLSDEHFTADDHDDDDFHANLMNIIYG